MPWAFVVAGCIGMFAATATGSTRAPFLPDMARDLMVSLPAIANLFGITATAWGISAYLTGYLSDRIGRRVFLLFSPALLAMAMFSIAFVESYWALVAIVVFSGMCCGAFTSTTLAEVSLRAHSSHHGRAFGYVMSGQSLTLLCGVPLAAFLGSLVGWRGTHMSLSLLAVFATMVMAYALSINSNTERATNGDSKSNKASLRDALTGPVVRLFLALIAERVCFGLAAFYYAAYLRQAYELPIESVALPLVGFALGNITGTIIGGQLADRYPYRRVSFAVALCAAGCIALPWFLWQPSLKITAGLGVVFAFFNALARPSLLAALADVPKEVRGVVMGMNSSIASIGWLTAALVGGWFYASVGFGGFGPFMAVMCFLAAAVVTPDSRIRRQQGD